MSLFHLNIVSDIRSVWVRRVNEEKARVYGLLVIFIHCRSIDVREVGNIATLI